MVRQEFGLSNLGAVKITYNSALSGYGPEELLQEFRTNYETRIAVTVNLIATGTDVKPIECVVFMRMVGSRSFFEQMKGRGVRVMSAHDLQVVTPDAQAKERFVLVDAVGVTETQLHDTVPLERKHSVGFDRLLNLIGLGVTSEDVVSSVASRLARLDKRITQQDRALVEEVADTSLKEIARGMVDALNPDLHYTVAKAAAGGEEPDPEQIANSRRRMIRKAVQPLAGNSELRETLIEIRRSYEQIIDTATQDQVISGQFSRDATDRARETVESFRAFIEDHRDEITALQILYSQPYGGGVRFDQIKELANAIRKPPRAWTPDLLWRAYEVLETTNVRGSGHRVNTDLVSLVRYALGLTDELVAFPDLVEERFQAWLQQQENAGRKFAQEQIGYLRLIKDHLAASLTIERRDLMQLPFSTHGGLGRATQLFGSHLAGLLRELTRELVA